MYSRYVLTVDGFIPETSNQADDATSTSAHHLAEGVLLVRPVTVSGARIRELHNLRIQEDDVGLPFLLRCRTVRRRDRHPSAVVIPGDLEVFLFRLSSPLEADH